MVLQKKILVTMYVSDENFVDGSLRFTANMVVTYVGIKYEASQGHA